MKSRKVPVRFRSARGSVTIEVGDVAVACHLKTETISFLRQRLDAEVFAYATRDGRQLSHQELIAIASEALRLKQTRGSELMVYPARELRFETFAVLSPPATTKKWWKLWL